MKNLATLATKRRYMASVTKKDIPEIAKFMTDLWEMVKDFWIPEDNDDYWDQVLVRAKRLNKQYNNDLFVMRMTSEVVAYLDEKWRKATGRWKE